jgi:TonB family protein
MRIRTSSFAAVLGLALALPQAPAAPQDPAAVEAQLREQVRTVVGTPDPLMKLARFYEEQGTLDSAEQTWLTARQQYADSTVVIRELVAFFARRAGALRSAEIAAGQMQTPAKPLPPFKPDCAEFSFGSATSGRAVLCAAEAAWKKAAALEKPPADAIARARAADERKQHLTTAAEYYEKAAGLLSEHDARAFAYEAAARAYGRQHLNQPARAENALRQLIAMLPLSPAPIVKLAALQEQEKLPDAAEMTLLGARQQFPADIELLKTIAKFYARIVSERHAADYRRAQEADPPAPPGQADAHGFYTIGGNIAAPKRANDKRPDFPPDAMLIGMEGRVGLELRVDESGRVIGTTVMDSVPLLDEAALAAARHWSFEPALAAGKPVPVRITLEMSFTIR